MKKKILMIGTGGTIASKQTEAGLAPGLSSEDILSYIPQVESCLLYTSEDTLSGETVENARKLYDTEGLPLAMKVGIRDLYQRNPLTASSDSGDVSYIMPMCLKMCIRDSRDTDQQQMHCRYI